jgi:peptide-methionine (S)-S-oxide reductase
MTQNYELATFGAGCFWCVEAIFQRLKGVISVQSGYTGGKTENPDYKSVCTGQTGHAEVIQIKFDPQIISFEDLLYVFWRTHDPTTLNQQGADKGTQYRSAVFYHTEEQKEIAEKSKKETELSKLYKDSIVTEITKISKFYNAEDYHQNYFNDNSFQPYCSFVISPKIKKLEKEFSDRLKLK